VKAVCRNSFSQLRFEYPWMFTFGELSSTVTASRYLLSVFGENLGELVRWQHEAVLVGVQEAVCDRLASCHRRPAQHMLTWGGSATCDTVLSAHLLLPAAN